MVAYDPLTGAPMESIMRRFRLLIVILLATLGGVRCSETPSSPGTQPPGEAASDQNTMPALIVSEALSVARVAAAVGAGNSSGAAS